MALSSIVLPHGFSESDRWVNTVVVRPLPAMTKVPCRRGACSAPALQVTGLLERLVSMAGDEPSTCAVRRLTAGDREAILLHLCRSLSGDRLWSLFDCPECGERVTLELAFSDLLVPPAAHPASEYHVAVDGRHMRLRAVFGADLESVSGDTGSAAESLARACVLESEPPLPEGLLPKELIEALSARWRVRPAGRHSAGCQVFLPAATSCRFRSIPEISSSR